MKGPNADSGQTFTRLALIVSLADAWQAGTPESMAWLEHHLPRSLREMAPGLATDDEFQSWIRFFWGLLHSAGTLGETYGVFLYFVEGQPAVRWPPKDGSDIRWRLSRQQVESAPDLFQEAKHGLVFRKSSETKGVSIEDLFLAIATDQASDRPYTDHLKLALDENGLPTSLSEGESIPVCLATRFPEDDLVVLPCDVELSQSELIRAPFFCGPADFRKATSLSLQEVIFNLSRDIMGVLGLEVPSEARDFSPKEVKERVLPREGDTLREKFLNVPPAHERSRQEIRDKVSDHGGFSSGQWELLDDLSDVHSPEVGTQAIKALEKLPPANGELWSQLLNEALCFIRVRGRGRRRDGLIMARCAQPYCWYRFAVADHRHRFCQEHRQSQFNHRGSKARAARRARKRTRSDPQSQPSHETPGSSES